LSFGIASVIISVLLSIMKISAQIQETRKKILSHIKANGWTHFMNSDINALKLIYGDMAMIDIILFTLVWTGHIARDKRTPPRKEWTHEHEPPWVEYSYMAKHYIKL